MKIKKMIKIFSIIFTSFFIFKVSAAPINLYASRTSVTVGQTVVITAKTTDAMGSYTISSSNSSVLSGGTSGGFSTPKEQVTTTFVAKKEGSATITFRPVNMALFSNEKNYTSPSSITITVGTPIPKSSDNTLSSLSLDQGAISPTFSKTTTSYTALVEAGTTKVNIKAAASDPKAKISGIGEREVKEGDNSFDIVVTAENGSSKTYTIKVTVQEFDPIETKINGKKYSVVRNKASLPIVKGYEETTVKIEGEDVPAFKSSITGFTLVALKDEKGNQNLYIYKNNKYTLYKEYTFNRIILYPMEIKKVPNGYKKTTITFNDEKIVAYKYRENSNYALIYGMNIETGKKNLYMYEREEDTLQIYNDEKNDNSNDKINNYSKIIAGLCGLSTFFFLLWIINIIRNHKHNKQQKKIKKELKRKKKQQKKEWDNDDIDVNKIM